MHSQSLLASVLAAVSTAVLAPRGVLAQSSGAYLGCYVDAGETGSRTLNYGAYTASNNTNELCQSTCSSLGYAYSGTEYGTECFCDNWLNTTTASDSDCHYACAGNNAETCGGDWRLTVYSTGAGSGTGTGSGSGTGTGSSGSPTTSTTAPVSTPTAPSGAGFLGCYMDNASSGAPRSLNFGAYQNSDNTNELCQSTCAGLGYAYSGTEYGEQCFCDNALNATLTTTSSCDIACTGDASETCGGHWLLTVYSTGVSPGSGSGSGSGTGTGTASTSGVSSTSVSASSTSTTATSTWTSTTATSTWTSTTATSTWTSQSSPAPTSSTPTTVSPGTTSTTSSPPAPTATGNGYAGCYLSLTPFLSFTYTSAVNTNAHCRATCHSKGYAYAGTTAGLECSCMNSLGFALKAPSLACSVPCPGDWTQACGGPGSVSVYKTY